MKYIFFYTLCLSLFFSACINDKKKAGQHLEDDTEILEKTIPELPYNTLALKDLSAFRPTGKNWSIIGQVTANRNQRWHMQTEPGTGIIFNANDQEKNNNILTNFEHGNIELEAYVMMPKGSNSGIYFQGRYEIQLLDSWGVTAPKFSDIGGIYQRWDNNAPNGQQGYEGHSPKLNAAKAPGLWQHFKIIFHAPKFDSKGHKIKNALFKQVWLNGKLLHEDVELTGPTRAAKFKDESPLGPLMIQGDHGPVALKQIRYKLFDEARIEIETSLLKIFDNKAKNVPIPNLDSLTVLKQYETDSISPMLSMEPNDQKIFAYNGKLNIPKNGTYLFDATVNGGLVFTVANDTIINLNGDYDLSQTAYKLIDLKKGSHAYTLIYNKPFAWRRGVDLFVEGPNMERYSILKTDASYLIEKKPIDPIIIKVNTIPVTQRSFLNYGSSKKTHGISVGLPEGVNYSINLETASLLQVWGGDFLDVTQMWHSRGEQQVGEPLGISVSSHGDLDFSPLSDENSAWPKTLNPKIDFKQIGYEFVNAIPVFTSEINGNSISQSLSAINSVTRGLKRTIESNAKSPIYHKIASGAHIIMLSNTKTYRIDDESYYITFDDHKLKPIIRNSRGKDELLVEIPKGKSSFNYNIIW